MASLSYLEQDDDIAMTAAATDPATSTSAPISTAGLFKSKGKKKIQNANSTTAADTTTSTATTSIPVVSSTSTSTRQARTGTSASTSLRSFNQHEEDAEEAASTGVDLVAMKIKQEKRERRKEKGRRGGGGGGGGAEMSDAAIAIPLPVTPVASSSAYTPEALAEMRRNARSYKAADKPVAVDDPSSPSIYSNNSKGVDSADVEYTEEINLASLQRLQPGGDLYGVIEGAGSFRNSAREKQQRLQELDDARSMRGKKRDDQLVSIAVDNTDKDDARTRELDQLQQDRLVRAARLQRERMRIQGGDFTGSGDFIPLSGASGAKSIQLSSALSGSSLAQLDKNYSDAIINIDDEDDIDAHKSTMLREDPDDEMQQEYDDEDAAQGSFGGDRRKFGDPLATATNAKKKQDGNGKPNNKAMIGALINNSSAQKEQRVRAITTALGTSKQQAIDVDDLDGGGDDEGGINGEDEEMRKWEEEIMRKGGASEKDIDLTVAASLSTKLRTSASQPVSLSSLSLSQQLTSSLTSLAQSTNSSLSSIDPIDVMLNGLEAQAHSLHSTNQTTNKRFMNVEKEMLETQKKLAQLDATFIQHTDSYEFYQQISEKIITTLDCLSTKSTDVDAAVQELRDIKRKWRDDVRKEVRRHEAEMKEEAFGSSTIIIDQAPQLDEFGRDISSFKEEEKKERKERRKVWMEEELRRNAASASASSSAVAAVAAASSSPPHPLGWSSLMSLALSSLDSTSYHSSLTSLISDTSHIFSDTSFEYRTLHTIVHTMEEWKAKDRIAYEQAFIPESLPTILAPYVKLELVQTWHVKKEPRFSMVKVRESVNSESAKKTNKNKDDENDESSSENTKKSWYDTLFNYGISSSTDSSTTTQDDEDSHLLPRLVDSLVVPFVTSFIQDELDIYNEDDIEALKICLDEVETHMIDAEKSQNMNNLKDAILEQYKQALETHVELGVAPLVEPSTPLSVTMQNQAAWCQYRFFSALHLLSSLTRLSSFLDAARVKQTGGLIIVQALLPFLAWKCAQVDILSRESQHVRIDTDKSALVEVMATASNQPHTPMQELLLMVDMFLHVFPKEWIMNGQQSPSSMMQLYQMTTQLKEQKTNVNETIKQLRALLKK